MHLGPVPLGLAESCHDLKGHVATVEGCVLEEMILSITNNESITKYSLLVVLLLVLRTRTRTTSRDVSTVMKR